MKHFINADKKIYAYESDGSQDDFIIPGLVPISDEDLAILRAPAPPTEAELHVIWKASRAEAVAAITVTTAAGNTFDGDEISQGRMARAICALRVMADTTGWVLADNTSVLVNKAELIEALSLAGSAQTLLWTRPVVEEVVTQSVEEAPEETSEEVVV